ncbi:MAG: tetratricopeptide repeat protein [Dehalococcoidia bacterium]
MTTKATSGEFPFESDGGPFDSTVQHAFEGGAPMQQLAEEIVRAALELDDPYLDGDRRRRIAHAIAESLTADEPRRGLAGWATRWVTGWALVAGALLIAASSLLGGYAWALRGAPPATAASAPAEDGPAVIAAMLNQAYQDQVGGHVAQAIATYHAVLERDPENRIAAYNLGVISQAAGRTADAERYYLTALVTDETFAPALFNLAILRTETGALTEAADLYRRIIATDPANAPAHLNLGVVLQRTGDAAGGAAALQRAVELDPQLASRIPAQTARVAR